MTGQPQPIICAKCIHSNYDGRCAQEDFCKGCNNFDSFYNSCKLAEYKTSIGGKKEKIHPKTNHSRWLLAIVGCASDTRTHSASEPTPDLSHISEERRSCLFCLDPCCPIWQAADQNCWMSQKEHDTRTHSASEPVQEVCEEQDACRVPILCPETKLAREVERERVLIICRKLSHISCMTDVRDAVIVVPLVALSESLRRKEEP